LSFSFGTITVFLFLCTVALFYWFFRAKDEDYTADKNVIFDENDIELNKKNISEEGKHE